MIPEKRQPLSAFGQENLLSKTQPEPSLGETIGAFVSETYQGEGSMRGSIAAMDIEAKMMQGTPIDEEQFKLIAGSSGAQYREGMTLEAAQALVNYTIDTNLTAQSIVAADGWKTAAGYAAAFGTGIVEPKNIAYGVAGSAVFAPFAALTSTGRTLSRISAMRNESIALGAKMARTKEEYKALAKVGAMDGLIGAALMEPSIHDTADTLQRDYTMMDSLFNLGTSVAFGTAARTLPPLIADKWNKYKGRTLDVITAEVDMSTSQLEAGKRINVDVVEKMIDGKLAGKPLAERVQAIRQTIRGQTDADILPPQNDALVPEITTEKPKSQDAVEYRKDIAPQTLEALQNPDSWVVREKDTGKTVMEVADKAIVEKLNTEKYEAVPINEHLANLNGTTYQLSPTAKLKAERVRAAALGEAETIDTLTARIDADNKAAIEKGAAEDMSPMNDTALDEVAMARLEAEMEARGQTTYKDQINAYMDDLARMKEEGLLSDAEEQTIIDLMEQYDTANMEEIMKSAHLCLTGV
jgi:hypothetical protein